MAKPRLLREFFVMAITCFAILHAVKSIYSSVSRQIFLHSQAQSLENTKKQALEINKDLRNGLNNYRSSSGLERLARERLNLVGQNEIMIRIGK